jgi:hypothetical protein
VRFCVAVGTRYGGGTIALHWDGDSWTIVPTPNEPAPAQSFLRDVSCLSARFCMATGHSFIDTRIYPAYPGGARTMAQVWDGRVWSIVPTPNGGTPYDNNSLAGVSCRSARECTAAGSWAEPTRFGPAPASAVLQEWNGRAWRMVAVPTPPIPVGQPPALGGVLEGISCPANPCVAVGESYWSDPGPFGYLSRTFVVGQGRLSR